MTRTRSAAGDGPGRNVPRPAVFNTLERLERKGFVTSSYGDRTPIRVVRQAVLPGDAARRHAA